MMGISTTSWWRSTFSSVASPRLTILSVVDLWRNFRKSASRLNDSMMFRRQAGKDSTKQTLIKMPRIRGHIKFDNVTFRYPTRADKNALQNVNLEILPGQTIALVGRSGAGKIQPPTCCFGCTTQTKVES